MGFRRVRDAFAPIQTETEPMGELTEQLDPEAFSAAEQRGTARTIEVMTKEILAGTSGAD
jgi:hypothetical protein